MIFSRTASLTPSLPLRAFDMVTVLTPSAAPMSRMVTFFMLTLL